MKDKIGFNVIFAILAFPIGLALFKDTDFHSWTFRKPALDIWYLIVFIALLFFMLKKQNKEPQK
jgi:hypothetical protein